MLLLDYSPKPKPTIEGKNISFTSPYGNYNDMRRLHTMMLLVLCHGMAYAETPEDRKKLEEVFDSNFPKVFPVHDTSSD